MKEVVREKKQWEKPIVKQVVLKFDKDVAASCHINSTINTANACESQHYDKCN